MNIYIKIYSAGLLILIGAIFLNFLAIKLNISTWYPFLDEIKEKGFKDAFSALGISSIIFLFLIYPFLLGLVAFLFFNWVR